MLCRRPASERCCGSHLENGQHSLTNHQYGVANLLNNVRPLMITSTELDKNAHGVSKNTTTTNNMNQNLLNQKGNHHDFLMKLSDILSLKCN